MTWTIRYSVKGNGYFPTDMLRYDSSHPAGELDSFGVEQTREERTVKLVHTGAFKAWKPTTGRWNSFSWEVVDVNLPVKVA